MFNAFCYNISAFIIQSCWRRFLFRRYIITRILVRRQIINFRRSAPIKIPQKVLSLSW